VPDLRVLITNCWVADRGGTELYVRDLALGLQRLGHRPAVWSPILGDVAGDLRAAGVPVFDDLAAVSPAPDVVHGQHGDETRAALSRFPSVPGIYVQHDAEAWQDVAPAHPRLLRWAAVDELCRERLLAHGADPARTTVIQNSVDLHRFPRRDALPARPQRALMFSNTATETGYLPIVRAACDRLGIQLDVIGSGFGAVARRPEELLGRYDLVFAKARAALEALATGCAVVVLDQRGMAGLVDTGRLPEWRRWNFGRRLLTQTHDVDRLAAEIDRYDPQDAARCTDLARADYGLDPMVEALLGLYTEVVEEWAASGRPDPEAELVAAATSLATLGPLRLAAQREQHELTDLRQQYTDLSQQVESVRSEFRLMVERAELAEADASAQRAQAQEVRAALADVLGGRTMRLRAALISLPVARSLLAVRSRRRATAGAR
jgi:glycosyltransferase involved in cell wall biosynthesis